MFLDFLGGYSAIMRVLVRERGRRGVSQRDVREEGCGGGNNVSAGFRRMCPFPPIC